MLVIASNATLQQQLRTALSSHQVEAVTSVHSAAERLEAAVVDLVVVVQSRRTSAQGNTVHALRSLSDVALLVAIPEDTPTARAAQLVAGADDVVSLPISALELAARALALLRRHRAGSRAVIRIRELEIDLRTQHVRIRGRTVHLTPTEFRLLALLAHRPERSFTRQEILEHLWSSSHTGSERTCDIYISNLRHKIEPDFAHPEYILTVRGAGYLLSAA